MDRQSLGWFQITYESLLDFLYRAKTEDPESLILEIFANSEPGKLPE